MSTKLISSKIEKALNEQVTQEADAAQFYLSLASWVDVQGFEGIAAFLYNHMQEEREHMKKLVDYINLRGRSCEVQTLKAPNIKPKNLHNLFEMVLGQEIENSANINAIVGLCLKEKDFPTFNFMQWFVAEQIEEEALATKLLDKLKIIGDDRSGLYAFDKDITEIKA